MTEPTKTYDVRNVPGVGQVFELPNGEQGLRVAQRVVLTIDRIVESPEAKPVVCCIDGIAYRFDSIERITL